MDRMLSGHPQSSGVPEEPQFVGAWDTQISELTAWTGFWGRSFTANLTPDPETGLGKWTLRDFVDLHRLDFSTFAPSLATPTYLEPIAKLPEQSA